MVFSYYYDSPTSDNDVSLGDHLYHSKITQKSKNLITLIFIEMVVNILKEYNMNNKLITHQTYDQREMPHNITTQNE